MKYNIMGFYQPRAVELGLDSNDLLVLRWFVDYRDTGKMRQVIIDNKIFYWVNYATVLEELPVLKVTKQTLARKYFGNLVKANVLEHQRVTEGGCFSYYCYGINYSTLVYLQGNEQQSLLGNASVTKCNESGQMSAKCPPPTGTKLGQCPEPTKKYGEYGWIKLTDTQYNKLIADYGQDRIYKQIQLLDEYVQSNGNKNKYKDFNLVLRKSIKEGWFTNEKANNGGKSVKISTRTYTAEQNDAIFNEFEEMDI